MTIAHLAFFLNVALTPIILGVSLSPSTSLDFRLGTNVIPLEYQLNIQPYLNEKDCSKRFTFSGDVYVNITASKNVKKFVMHSQNLNYSLIEYRDTSSKNWSQFDSFQIEQETIVLSPKESLIVNKTYTIHFLYAGHLENGDSIGFFRSSYTDNETNEQKWIACTQFEPTYARRAFPCFDEPSFKATFQLTIIRDHSLRSFTNTRLVQTKFLGNNTYADIFARTPKMPIYTLAFLVSEFVVQGNERFSVTSRPESISKTTYGLETGQRLLEKFGSYLELSYYEMGIDKMNLVAIPGRLIGCMENWGLILFMEEQILIDPDVSISEDKFASTQLIAHEIAHMWFGNLVTCEWWNFIWLNEGFARYFQFVFSGMIYPEWNMESQFVMLELQYILEKDSQGNNPVPLNDRSIVGSSSRQQIFNSFAYKKGGCIIRMIRYAIGEDRFKKSIQGYLVEFKYKNVNSDDLWKHFEKNWSVNTRENAKNMFRSFITQVGYPLITVNVSADGTSMEISQKRFLKNSNGADSSLLYTVPISYTTNIENQFNETEPKLYLEANSVVTKVSLTPCDYVIVNIQRTGYYRVNYNYNNWVNIFKALNSENWGNIPEINRANFLDDMIQLAEVGELKYNFVLGFMEYLKTEIGYFPWMVAINFYKKLGSLLGTSAKSDFENYLLPQIDKVYHHLGFMERKNDTLIDITSRNIIVPVACKYGHQDCVSEALRIFELMNETTTIPNDMLPVVYCTVAREGIRQSFETLYARYKSKSIESEQTPLLNALGCVRNHELIEKIFFTILRDDLSIKLRINALTSLYASNSENPLSVLKLIIENYNEFEKSMESSANVITVISKIISLFNTDSEKEEILELSRRSEFDDHDTIEGLLKKSGNKDFIWMQTVYPSFIASGSSMLSKFKLFFVLISAFYCLF